MTRGKLVPRAAGGVLAGLIIASLGISGAQAHSNGYDSGPNHYADDTYVSGSAVEGGEWYYGVHAYANDSGRNVDSSYYHWSASHRASVKANGVTVTSAIKSGGTWAQATRSAAAWGNEAYWDKY